MFTTVFTVLIASLAIGFAVSIIIFVPLTLYIIPYCLWLGVQNTKGKYRHLQDGNCFRMARNPPLWIMDLPQSSGILMPGL